MALHRAGDLSRAEQLYAAVAQADPGNPDAWHLLGIVKHAQTTRATRASPPAEAAREASLEAAALIRRALELEPGRADFWCNLGEVLRAAGGQLDQARHALKHALDLDPSHAMTLYNLAFLDSGQLGLGAPHLEPLLRRYLALSVGPGESCSGSGAGGGGGAGSNLETAHGMLGDNLRARGLLREAVAHFSRCGERPGGHSALTALQLGVSLHQSGQLARASEAYALAADLGTAALGQLGKGGQGGQGGESGEGAAAAEALARQVWTARSNWAVAVHESGDLLAAVDLYKRLLREAALRPGLDLGLGGPEGGDDPTLRNNLGAALLAAGRYEEAVDALERGIAHLDKRAAAVAAAAEAGKEGSWRGGASRSRKGRTEEAFGGVNLHVNLAGHWAEEGCEAKALHHYTRALNILDSSSPAAAAAASDSAAATLGQPPPPPPAAESGQASGLWLRMGTMLPAIPASWGAVGARRDPVLLGGGWGMGGGGGERERDESSVGKNCRVTVLG